MAKTVEAQLSDVGKRLSQSPVGKAALVKILEQAAALYSEIEQSPSESILASMKTSIDSLVQYHMLRHKDDDVRVLVATCLSEILRIVAPEAPYDDDQLKDVFQLIVSTFKGLNKLENPTFLRRVRILEMVAKVRSCVVMLDLECEDLILEMFQAFFSTASEKHTENVVGAMQTIMTLVIDESEDQDENQGGGLPKPLIEELINNLYKSPSVVAHELAKNVIKKSEQKLIPYVQHYLKLALPELSSEKGLSEDSLDMLHQLYGCSPEMVLTVIPVLDEELQMESKETRIKVIDFFGRLFSSQSLPHEEVKQFFTEYIRKFSEKDTEVILSTVKTAKNFLLTTNNLKEADTRDTLMFLNDRLKDSENRVREQSAEVICEFFLSNPTEMPVDVIMHIADLLEDVVIPLRKYALHKLTEAYRMFCVKQNKGQDLPTELFEWIPSRIVRCCVDEDCEDFRPQNLELMLTKLFPLEITVPERVKHMISMLVFFKPNDEKALGRILSYKHRFQQEMQSYLSLRQRAKAESSPDILKQMKYCWKKMCSAFIDPANAEEGFEKLNQIKDDSIFKSLSSLLDASAPVSEIQSIQDGMLQRLGKQHLLLDFMKLLAPKCSYALFNKEHMASLLGEVTKLQAAAGKQDLFMASISLLKHFSKFFPAVAEGAKEGLLKLMKEGNELSKQVAVQVLGNSCAIFLRQQTETNGFVESFLEKLCLEGSRMDAKLAVQILVTFAEEDSDSSTLPDLYEKLVDSLQTSLHLPTVLQSIGCIAERAGTTMNLRNNEVVQFIKEEVLTRHSKIDHESAWNAVSEECMLKVLGLKTMTKSILGRKDADQQHLLISELFGVLTSLIKCGEESEETNSSELEKAYLRLASAKCVLRLSRRLDDQIPPQLFHAAVLTALDSSAHVRLEFLAKVHACLVNRSVSLKYACAFPLAVTNATGSLLNLVKRYLNDFLEVCQLDMKPEKIDTGKGSDAFLPEYVLVYLVHVMAHHSLKLSPAVADLSSEDTKPCCMQLLFLLWGLLSGSGEPESLHRIAAIFHSIKISSDAIDSSRTESVRFICNLGSLILNSLMESNIEFPKDGATVSLPSNFYKILDPVELQDDDQDQPKCLDSVNVDSQVKGILTELSLDMEKVLDVKLKSVNVQDTTLPAEGSLEGTQTEKPGQSNLTENGNSHSKTVSSISKSVPSRKRDQRTKASTKVVDATLDAGAMATEQAVPPSALKRKRGGADKAISKAPSPDTRKEAEGEDTLNTNSERRKRPRKTAGKAVEEPAKSVESEKEALPMEIDTKAVEANAASESGQENVPNSPKEADIETKPVTSAKKLKISEGTSMELPPQSVESAGEAEEPHKRANGKKLRKKSEVHNGTAENSATPIPKSPRETPRRAVKMINSRADDKTPGSNGKDKTLDERHIGLRIKVWWPMDRRFYEGVIESYDTAKKRHTVLYNDGDVEVLNFAKQRWELIDSSTAQPGELAGSPDRPAEISPTKQDNSSSTVSTKAKSREDMKADSSAEKPESLPKRRKRTEVGHVERTPGSKSAVEKSTEKPKEDEKSNDAPEKEKDDSKANEKVNRRVTALRSPGRPPAAARSPRKAMAKTPVPQEEVVKSPRRKTQETTLLDGKTSSPVTSKDSDDVPLKAWKSRTRKAH